MVALSKFVGREAELSKLEALVRDGASLVTLWGPGGAGKTRLAREYAQAATKRGARVVWAELEAARSRDDVAAAVALALGVSIDRRHDAAAVIGRAAAAQRAFVIADNVEQIDREGRALLVTIARGGARVIVTSRASLGVPEEQIVDLGQLPESAALMLLAMGGTTTNEGALRAIVKRLDAMPLAIELAAARMPLLGAEELLARLDHKLDVLVGHVGERGERHASLRAAIAWSWGLLEASARTVLGACAVFEAPFDAVLVEAMIGPALDALEHLRQRALLHSGPPDERGRPTLRLLEVVRDFVRENAADDERQLFEARHAAAVIARCAPLSDALARGAAVPPELARRRADLAAIVARAPAGTTAAQAALVLAAHSAVVGPVDAAVDLARAAAESVRGGDAVLAAKLDLVAAEALRAIGRPNEALALAEGAVPYCGPHARRVLGAVRRALGQVDAALADLDAALAGSRAEGDRACEALCLGEIGAALQSQGRLVAARERHAHAIAIHLALGSRRAEGVQRSYLAVATHRAGEVAASARLHDQALVIHREVGHLRLEGAELLHLGFVHHELGAPGPACEALVAAREVLARAGARGLEAFALVFAARLDVDEGDHTTAMIHLAEAAECSPAGWSRLDATRRLVEGHLAMARGDAAAARVAYSAALAANDDVEVGFEALTPAYLALAIARADDVPPPSLLEQARARVRTLESPWLAIALEVLASGAEASPEAIAASSDVRRALAFVGTRRGLRVAEDASRVILPDGRAIDLSRRKNVRLVLRALVDARREHPGRAVGPEALVEAGWPGERMRADAATKRLHTAIWTLRSLGLGDWLRTDGDGYALDSGVPLEIATKL